MELIKILRLHNWKPLHIQITQVNHGLMMIAKSDSDSLGNVRVFRAKSIYLRTKSTNLQRIISMEWTCNDFKLFMKRCLNSDCKKKSTIVNKTNNHPSISPTEHKKRLRHMALEIKIMAEDRRNNVAGLHQWI